MANPIAKIKRKLSMTPEKRKIFFNSNWQLMDKFLRLGINLIVSIWIARYLGPEQFGQYNFAISFVTIIAAVVPLGLANIIVKELVEHPDNKNEILGTVSTLRMVSGLIAFAITVALAFAIPGQDAMVRWSIIIIAANMLFQPLDVISQWFDSTVEAKYAVYAKGIAFLMTSVMKVLLIVFHSSLIWFAASYALELILGYLFLLFTQMKRVSLTRWSFNWKLGKRLTNSSWPLIVAGISTIIYLKIDQVMLSYMINDTAVGIYAVAARLSEVWYVIPTVVAASYFPSMIKNKKLGPAVYHAELQKLYNLLFWFALAICIAVTLMAKPVISILYGKAYLESISILVIHVWACLFIFMRAALNKWIISEGLYRFELISQVMGALTKIIINLILIPLFGGMGAAVGTVFAFIVSSYAFTFMFKETRVSGMMMSKTLISPITALISRLKAGKAKLSTNQE
ncbi:flippase [Paenibacillus hunanensis]|uniref:O-antigen/teichoic acid export membrane protein n=1 Tax=Paenibacillus hunanensis TaxID=539262 RepID=A0ABU1J346_9BACL|nr:flippase [Paenibacillus hunanensis]MDR6245924.1 O-antigen/teichoic acid export membrane protein [Paenibacillus hunanensis]GGJ14554.1 O-unit flippase [Paenibacillus hunanensis]